MKTPQRIASVNRSNGSAVIVVIALVGLLLVFVAANLRAISHFGRELKLLEVRQTRRLQHPPATTNTVPAAKGTEKSSL
jgi:hypothetical protein